MMFVIENNGQTNSFVDISYEDGKATSSVNLECVFSNSWESFVKFYRNNISLQERRQLTIAASKGRLDYKTSTLIREQEEEMLNILELPVRLVDNSRDC